MSGKSNTKKISSTSNHVKNTKTGKTGEKSDAVSLRWYHVVATVVVLSLAVIALIRVLSHFDISLYGSKYTMRYVFGCSTSIDGNVPEYKDSDYRYAGIEEGDYIGTTGITDSLEYAFVEIVELGSSRVKIKVRDYLTNEWHDGTVKYGETEKINTESSPDCMPQLTFSISR